MGASHGGVRWKTTSSSTTDAISGMTCTALAPVPITATRLPRRSTPGSQRAVWNAGPAKVSRPGMSGSDGRLSWPTLLITASTTTSSPVRRRRVQRRSASDQVAASTSVPNRMWRRRSNASAQSQK